MKESGDEGLSRSMACFSNVIYLIQKLLSSNEQILKTENRINREK